MSTIAIVSAGRVMGPVSQNRRKSDFICFPETGPEVAITAVIEMSSERDFGLCLATGVVWFKIDKLLAKVLKFDVVVFN